MDLGEKGDKKICGNGNERDRFSLLSSRELGESNRGVKKKGNRGVKGKKGENLRDIRARLRQKKPS